MQVSRNHPLLLELRGDEGMGLLGPDIHWPGVHEPLMTHGPLDRSAYTCKRSVGLQTGRDGSPTRCRQRSVQVLHRSPGYQYRNPHGSIPELAPWSKCYFFGIRSPTDPYRSRL